MAAEVPVCDVLCEAVEYLSKLGANLRTRSENLKGKKISKEKLRNAHAVQRAANKLLLICELSKKSLNNVENGVKKIINIVSASQSQSNSDLKSSTSKSMDRYKFFEFEKFKLRISKSVPVKHFLSAKVAAERMSTSMLEKYPVYCDCKLYRLRKIKKDKMELSKDKSHCSADENGVQNSLSDQSFNNNTAELEACSDKALTSDLINSCPHESDIMDTSLKSNVEEQSQPSSNITEDSSKDEKLKPNEVNISEKDDSKSSSMKNTKCNEKNKKYKRVSFLDDDSSNSEDKEKNTDDLPKNVGMAKSRPEAVEDDVICLSPDNETSDKNGDEDINKPLIKCVNITQLLKPDLAKKISLNNKDKKSKQKTKESRENSEVIHSLNRFSVALLKKKEMRDEEYWIQKRIEVSAFKPKSFKINITRLPNFSKDFLLANNLQKITQNGKLLLECKLEDTLPSESRVLNTPEVIVEKETFKQKESVQEAMKIKNALLNESDSDSSVSKEPKEKCEDSLNSKQSNKKVDSNLNNAIDSAVSKDTPLEGHKNREDVRGRQLQTPERTENNDAVKSALLHDSSEDLTPKRKRKRGSDAISPRTQSQQAKKTLLSYSSSESEDEDLKNALKNIKDQLLKGGSSDEDKGEKKVQKDADVKKDESIDGGSGRENNNQDSDKESGKETSTSSSSIVPKKKKKKIASPRAKFRRKSRTHSKSEDALKGLTNLRSLNKRSRRPASSSSSSDEPPARTTRNRIKMEKKAPRISKEDFLEAHSESDALSEPENEAEDEELPSMPVTGINGDGIGHLAKDDLLDESDSSASNDDKTDEKETEDSKKPTSDDDSTVKSRRRKPNAISSDSEAGSSRKKDKTVKMSDFEDSEDSSGVVKPNKRKKKTEPLSDASGSGSGSDDGGKKKRRRIKQVDESDYSDSDDGETEGRNKHGRKNIRKVMGKNQLEEATKKAAREEKERIARISERQKMYNNLEFDESGKPDEVVLEKVVLDFDPETKEPLIQVDRGLVKKLKPHQANGIKFMWDACFESVKRIKKDRGSGCILAHCMGLGKTLQVISLTHTLLTHHKLTGVHRVLVVCPLSTVLNWVNEITMWLKHTTNNADVDVYELSRFKQNSERAFQLQQWFDHGGVCVLGYEMFRNLSADNTKKYKKKMLKSFQQSLVDPGPDLVVCDEGHLLKNEKTSLSQSMNRVKTRRRIVLTGTPLQNNLKEYYCMVQFVKPNLLGKYNEYLNRFVNPITNGQYTDSTEHDIKIMKRRSHVLHKMLDGAVQRRDYGVLAPFLPPKHEYVLFITLSEVQIKFYQYYLDNFSRRPLPGKSSGFLFPDFQSLQRIWTHPLVLKYNSERYEIMQQKKREREEEEDSEGSLVDFIDDDSTPDESSTEDSSDDMSDASDDSRKKAKKKKTPKKSKAKDGKASTRRGTRANPIDLEDPDVEEVVEVKNENPTEWWIKLVTDDDLEDMRNSHKLVLLFDILRQCEAIGDKLLVFSQSLYSLDLIEHFLGKVDEATQEGRIDEKLGGHVGSWSPGVDYFRLDGSTSCENRSIWCKNFNREDNPRARLFLISTRAGGLGINLVAANRVVIFDVSWNPSHDVQSIFRVYRFGQKKPCYVYRFLAMGTMEEKIYERQVTKQAISKRVIDEQQIDRHYKENDLAELYKFEPQPPEPRPIPPLPKDRLFAEMLREHDKEIYKYHEHDSLLENKEEETLSEEERKAAWEDFENEKNRPPPAPFAAPWPLNGMAPGLFVQQQQQLAYAAIAAMLRKDMPNISDNQIRDMLPLIYNSNPALMQKMSEIYKYAAATQPGMMNPAAMMNPVMNSGAGGGSGSGLQYEPPWQRQQQQMLQQMLQQQQHNQMGAKYYAGGLGSRDPVAMALQQQHARQLLDSRPRGRPPAAPRPADVVNLDSD